MPGVQEDKITPLTDPSPSYLAPLLTSSKERGSAARVRNSSFEFRSVDSADVETETKNGWQVQRQGKRRTRLKRPKNHANLLEDRTWMLLYRMGYEHLNDQKFFVDFERTDGSRSRKKIDIFARDEETAFVVECKSREKRERRSLQKDIHETICLQDFVRKSIYLDSKKGLRPKIIWLYVTYNIIWSESDVDRASRGNINVVTENELQYYETFIKHLGPAGRYQIIGEFLYGQKIPGLNSGRIPAIRGRIGGYVFYNFVTTPRRLLKISFVNHQALNHPDGKPAYQRMISSSRIKEIGKFVVNGGYFPTNILVNFVERPRFHLLPNKENTDPNIKFGWLTLPRMYRSAWIIDGQHRLYGYSHLSDKYLDQSIFILAFENMETIKEADLFMTINHKQKTVPRSLLDSLLADLRLGDPDPRTSLNALASAFVKTWNADKSSPMFGRFAVPGVPAEPIQSLTISEAVKGLVKSNLLGRIVQRTRVPGPLTDTTDAATIERARKVLNGYFDRIREAHPTRWEAGREAFICVNPGLRAHLVLVGEIVSYLTHRKEIDFHIIGETEFIKEICEIAGPVFEMVRKDTDGVIKEKFSRRFGEGGVTQYLYNLCEEILKEYDDFGSEEFRKYIEQKESSRVEEANQFTIDVYQHLMDNVIQTLKSKYGTHILESGEVAYWELGIQNRNVKERAYKKQQEEPLEKRLRKEAYLDVLDLKEIVEHKNNWPFFEMEFNMAQPGEKKKSRHTSWMARFNEIRRIPAHKSGLRTYSDEDFEFLDWLRTQISERIYGND